MIVKVNGEVKERLYPLVRAYYNINQTLKGLKVKRDALNKDLKLSLPDGTVYIGDFKVTKAKRKTATLSKEKLLELGVSEEVLEKAMVITEYDTISIKKEKVC